MKTLLFALMVTLAASAVMALKEGDCEVCISVLTRFKDVLPKEDASDPQKIEKAFRGFCKDLKLKENRFVSHLKLH